MQRVNYWSNGKLANWLCKRATGKPLPLALTWDEWTDWGNEFKAKAPITYFMVEVVFTKAQNFVMFPSDVRHVFMTYMKNRFGDKIHVIQCDVSPGSYSDIDYRLLTGCFRLLEDFVEIELASIQAYKDPSYRNMFRRLNRFNVFETHRSKAAGLAYLLDAINTDVEADPDFKSHVSQMKRILALYEWWQVRKSLEIHNDVIERQDTDNLIELMKIRGSLWT